MPDGLDAAVVSEELRLLVDHAPAALALLDRDLRYLQVGKRWLSDYGLEGRDLRGLSHCDVFPEIGEEWRRVYQRALAGEIVRCEGDRFVRSDGSVQLLRWEVRPWHEAAGRIGGIVICTEDVTEMARQAEEAGQWLRLALAAAGAGAWEQDVHTRELVWSDELWGLFGLEKRGRAPSLEAVRGAVLPNDLARTDQAMQEASSDGGNLSVEFGVRWPDGSVHHLLSRARASRGANGTVEKYLGIVVDITKHRQVEDRLREHTRQAELRALSARTEEHARQLLDAAPDAILVVDEGGHIQLVNMQAERLFGYTRQELVGQPLGMLLPERFARAHEAHMRRFHEHPMARPMGAGTTLVGKVRGGAEVPVEVSLSPLKTESGWRVCAAVRDITERRRLEQAASVLAERLRSAVEIMEEAFALYDEQERLVLCNGVFAGLLQDAVGGSLVGRTYEELFDAATHLFVLPEGVTREALREQRLESRRGKSTWAADVRLKDGRSLRITNRRTTEGGIVTTIWNLTEQEKRQEELRVARAGAETASDAKTEFLASMSHELRTPLNAVLGFAQLLLREKREPLTERQKDRVRRILLGGEHLLRLVDDVLDLARIEAGSLPISIAPSSVVDILHDVRRTLEPLEAQYAVHIEIEPVPADLPLVAADRTRLVQILTNFGSNGLKYNKPGGRVCIEVTHSEDVVRVTVRDTGIGIPLAKQPLLFQPFQRAGQETGPIEGTGIGLAITRRLATMMNGSVGFESVEGEGSRFWVELPRENGLGTGTGVLET